MGLFQPKQPDVARYRQTKGNGMVGGDGMRDTKPSMIDEFDDGLDISSLIGDDADDIVMTDGDEWSGEDDTGSKIASPDDADAVFDDVTQPIDAHDIDDAFDDFDDDSCGIHNGTVDDDGSDTITVTVDQLRDIISSAIDEKLSDVLNQISDETKETSSEVKAVRRLYHNNYAKQLSSMQAELDGYHKIDKGRIYEPILRDIAHVVVNSYFVPDIIEDERIRRSFSYVIEELIQMLDDYGAHMQKSEPGEKRNPHYCQIIHRIPTDDPSLHDTIKESHAIGFYVENRPLIREQVDVYAYVKPRPSDSQKTTN